MIEHVPIRALAAIINPAVGRKLIAVLSAYFDASFTDPKGITSVAGYVAPAEEWQKVEDTWLKALDDLNLERFHLAELEYKKGKEWARICTNRFTSIITKSRLHAVGAALFDADWDQADWGEDATPKLATPYDQCFDMALDVLTQEVQLEFKGERVAIICDQDAPKADILGVYAERSERTPEFISIAVGTSKDHRLLECADLGVGLLRRGWMGILTDKASDLSFGVMPTGQGGGSGRGRSSFWSLRQGAVLARAWRLEQENGLT